MISNPDVHFNNTNDTLNQNGLDIIHAFISMIDNNNAASTIGTIDFMDTLSKFYQTHNSCQVPLDNGTLTPEIIKQYIPGATPLYHLPAKGGRRRGGLTRRKKAPTHHVFTKHRTMKK